jgi:hypothetical protein
VRDAEALAHAEGVVADPAACFVVGQADQAEHLVDPAGGQTHGPLCESEDLSPGAAGVLGGRVEQDTDLRAGNEGGLEDLFLELTADTQRDSLAGGVPADEVSA